MDITFCSDIGNTICRKDHLGIHLFPSAIETLRKMYDSFAKIYLVSKVSLEQEIRSKNWLYDNCILEGIGINWTNVFYCRERSDKAPIARMLNAGYFIDDRLEVLSYLDSRIKKFAFRPSEEDIFNYQDLIEKEDIKIIQDWEEVLKYI